MRKTLRVLCAVLVMHIVQTTILPRVTLLAIQPDLLLGMLTALTLDGNRYLGFCAGSVAGLLMDAMAGHIAFLYLITYPLAGYAAARISPWLLKNLPHPKRFGKFFPDKRLRDGVLMITSAALALADQLALMMYRYLNGTDVTLEAIGRILAFALYTAVAAFFVQYLLRFCLTFASRRGGAKAPAFRAKRPLNGRSA